MGSESLYIDGKVAGTIYLSGGRVTVGCNGQVSADICAREVVVLGAVHGNVDASDRPLPGTIPAVPFRGAYGGSKNGPRTGQTSPGRY
jgi:hypothetical protein